MAVKAIERCHYETASISFFGLPRFASVPVWDRSSRLHEALTGSISNWIALAIDPKLARIADRSTCVSVINSTCNILGSIQFSLV